MTGLFAFDLPMYCDKNGVYCNTTLTEEVFQRYFSVVDTLFVVIRVYHMDCTYKDANMKKVDVPNMIIIEEPNFLSIKGILQIMREKEKIEELVKKSDLFFLRLPAVISDMTADLCRKYDKPYLVEVGGCAWDAFWNHGIVGKICAPYMYFRQKKTVLNSTFATYVTEKWLQDRYPCKCESISASNVYLPDFLDETIQRRLKKIEDHGNNTDYYIGTTAAVDVKYKGQEYVIKALPLLKQKGYHFIYEMVGAGDTSYLKRIAEQYGVSDQVVFKGRMLHDDVILWLDHLDFYAQPSKQEGLPRALIEAMSRGCPSIGSTTAGIPELLEEKAVFGNGKVDEIASILLLYVRSDLKQTAIRNYEYSKRFEKDLLNSRRNAYFAKYKESVPSSRR